MDLGELFVTEKLKSCISEYLDNDEAMKYVGEFVLHYMSEYSRALKETNEASAAYSFYAVMDQMIELALKDPKYTVSCREGCSYCCEQLVEINDHEAQLIVEWCDRESIEIDRGRLLSQSRYTLKTWSNHSDRACIFLEEGRCKIYKIRPIYCRKYFVTTPPRKCNVDTKKHVAMFVDFKVEALVSAVWNITKFKPMPGLILKHL